MTGVNPGKHCIFDFTRRVPGTYDVAFVNSSFRKVTSIWQLLSQAGRRVGVLGMPGTYPPEALNGCMISGFDSPVTTRANRSFIYPAALADEVMRLGGFSFADFQEYAVGPSWYPTARQRLLQGVENKCRLAATLLERESWDCFTIVFGESDTVAHHFWHLHDARSPRHDPEAAARYGDTIERVYRALDAAIDQLFDAAPADASVLVVSDHGFGGAGDAAIYLNRWLASRGWLQFAQHRSGGMAGLLKGAALAAIPSSWQGALFRGLNGRVANRLESRARFAGIEWTATRAFSEELNYFPSVWVNRAGRDPLGRVTDADYDEVCSRLASDLLQWRHEASGRPVVQRVWRRDELYHGPWTEHAPDLVLELAEDAGYSYTVLPSRGTAGPSSRRLEAHERAGGKRFGTSGSHRRDGLYVLAGPGVVPAGERDADMLDMAPTLLALCGEPVPQWMEGSSLLAPAGAPVPPGDGRAVTAERYYEADDARVVEARLRALGYIG
jgi:predicted AlkP superfamily phosphohydrolase/phosphomutase